MRGSTWLCGFVGGVYLHPWTVSWGQACPRGGRCHCEPTSLSLWRPFSPLPAVTCYLRSPRHRCTSLEQGQSCHCFQQVCSLLSVFTQGNENSVYVQQLTKCKSLREAGMKSMLFIFPRANERLAEISTKLEVEKQQNRSLLRTPSSTPVLDPSSVRNSNPISGLNANLISRAIVGFSTSVPHRSNDSVETYLTKVSSFLFFPLGFRFLI